MHVKGFVIINSIVHKVLKIFILRCYIILINLEVFFIKEFDHSSFFLRYSCPDFIVIIDVPKNLSTFLITVLQGFANLFPSFSLIFSVSLHVPKYMCSPCPAKIVPLVPQISIYSFSLASCTCAFWPDVEYLSCGLGLERGLKKIYGVWRGPEGTASHPRRQKKRSSESRLAAKCQRLTVDSNNEQCPRSGFSFQFSLSILFNSFLHVFLRVCLATFFISGCALGLLT